MTQFKKFEIRISKFEKNSKSKFSNVPNKVFQSFEFWSFDIVSDFGFSAYGGSTVDEEYSKIEIGW
jgi:hypothetical protein